MLTLWLLGTSVAGGVTAIAVYATLAPFYKSRSGRVVMSLLVVITVMLIMTAVLVVLPLDTAVWVANILYLALTVALFAMARTMYLDQIEGWRKRRLIKAQKG